MKNNRIVRAYDSINPSPRDKQRMLDAILAEANLPEEPRRQERSQKRDVPVMKREPNVYKMKPTPKRRRGSWIGPLAACLLVAVLGGFVLSFVASRQGVNPAYAQPTTEATQPTGATAPTEEAVQLPEGIYRGTIAKYARARDEGWDRTMCVENGISMLTPIESAYEGLYYALFDLNGDDVEELIISEYPYREDTDTNFIDIYTVLDGHVIQVMSLGDTDMRYLCEGGYVKDLSAPERGEYNAYVSLWQLQEDQFVQTGHVYNIDGQWFHGFRADEKITAAEAEAEVKALKPLYLDFTEIKSSGETEYQSGYEGYDHVIQKYVTALTENWTEAQCQQNDISPMILDNTTITHNLGWCLVDIDKNGIEELVISDGVNLFDLYVMMPHDGGPGHLISANGGEAWSLRENGVILQQGWYSGASAWRFYTLSDIDLIQKDVLFYVGETNQYSYGADDDSLTPISKDKAGEIIARDENAELEVNFFVPQTFDPDEVLQYQSLLELYQKALREDWNPAVCMENGLSLMVAHRGDYYENLGYAMQDLDGNGIDELIITDGLNIYDLYTIIQDEEVGPLHLISAMERIQYYLTTDGWIYNLGSGGAAVSYYTLYSLDGRELKLLEGYMMDADTDPNNPWFYYDGENRLGPCPTAEAAAATDAIVFQEIPFTPFQ